MKSILLAGVISALPVWAAPPPQTRPPTPTGFTVPASSNNGAFIVSWDDLPASLNIDRYELSETSDAGNSTYSTQATSLGFQKSDGTYTYKVRACYDDPGSEYECGYYTQSQSIIVSGGGTENPDPVPDPEPEPEPIPAEDRGQGSYDFVQK